MICLPCSDSAASAASIDLQSDSQAGDAGWSVAVSTRTGWCPNRPATRISSGILAYATYSSRSTAGSPASAEWGIPQPATLAFVQVVRKSRWRGSHEHHADHLLGMRLGEQLHVSTTVGVPDQDVRRGLAFGAEQGSELLDDSSGVARRGRRVAAAIARARVRKHARVERDLARHIIPGPPVGAQARLEHDCRLPGPRGDDLNRARVEVSDMRLEAGAAPREQGRREEEGDADAGPAPVRELAADVADSFSASWDLLDRVETHG